MESETIKITIIKALVDRLCHDASLKAVYKPRVAGHQHIDRLVSEHCRIFEKKVFFRSGMRRQAGRSLMIVAQNQIRKIEDVQKFMKEMCINSISTRDFDSESFIVLTTGEQISPVGVQIFCDHIVSIANASLPTEVVSEDVSTNDLTVSYPAENLLDWEDLNNKDFHVFVLTDEREVSIQEYLCKLPAAG